MAKKSSQPIPLELLAPAKNADTAISAIMSGADAVYMGASSHGARKEAANSIDDIRRVIEVAHPFNAKVYATVNTIVYDNEIADVERLISSLYTAGVDALIVQDMGILRMDIPPIELHASTQCDIRDVAKAEFLADAGFSRLVLARELSRDEIQEIHSALPHMPLEAFIHGALCVSYSGDCRASCMTGGRSANRGECAQICRLPYTLTDHRGRTLVESKHLLSLRDLNRSDSISEMADAGVTSFKIEGRLKEEGYVRNTVAWYSRILDRVVEQSGGRYMRQSFGKSKPGFNPSPDKSFNRGFTTYFFSGHAPVKGLASLDTPKATGLPVGKVTKCDAKVITASLSASLANGDGLGYFDAGGQFRGFRLNRADGNRLYPATPQNIRPGTTLYRNRDKEWDDAISSAKTSRTMSVDMNLRLAGDDTVALELTDESGCSVTATINIEGISPAVTPQESPRRQILNKLGGTIFRAGKIVDLAGQYFIPASQLTSLRRRGMELLLNAHAMTYSYSYRLPEKRETRFISDTATIHDNVANRLAEQFYRDHGVTTFTPAVEVKRPSGSGTMVMTTRYCLRRELGRCLLTPKGKEWPDTPMYLTSGNVRLRVEFDCKRCGMNLYTDSDH
ncbi:MAG: U32 family peptidase [Paenibacillus sp.]|nr:U32 family peptidase [Paenibacillus sp.]